MTTFLLSNGIGDDTDRGLCEMEDRFERGYVPNPDKPETLIYADSIDAEMYCRWILRGGKVKPCIECDGSKSCQWCPSGDGEHVNGETCRVCEGSGKCVECSK